MTDRQMRKPVTAAVADPAISAATMRARPVRRATCCRKQNATAAINAMPIVRTLDAATLNTKAAIINVRADAGRNLTSDKAARHALDRQKKTISDMGTGAR